MVFSKVGPNQSIEWGQIRVSKSAQQGDQENRQKGLGRSYRPWQCGIL